MKACAHCGTAYADAQEACPACGRKPGDPEGELIRSRDESLSEGFGPERRSQLILAIVFIVILLLSAALAWFMH